MKSTDSLNFAQKMASKIISDAWGAIEKLLPQNDTKEKLKVFANYLINRKI